MSHNKHWLTKLVPVLAFAAGIIMSSIGGVVTLSSFGKLAFFEQAPYATFSENECKYDYNRDIVFKDDSDLNKPYERTPVEIQECLTERKQQEQLRFANTQKQRAVDGLAALVVGLLLVFAFRRRD